MLNCYREICPHQAAERFIYKRVPYVETEQMRNGNVGHLAMEKRIGRRIPLPQLYLAHESIARCFDDRDAKVETKIGITREGRSCGFFDTNVWGRGKLDLHIINGERAYLNDFKFGKIREDPFELQVQSVLLHARYPQLKEIKGQYSWMQFNKLGKPYDLSDTAATWNEIGRLVRLIERDLTAANFEKREGPLCDWCPCIDCENNPNAQ